MRLRAIVFLVLGITASYLAGCGGGGSSTPNPVPSAPASATRVVLMEGAPFSLQPGTATFKNVDQPPAGTIDGMLEWNGGNDMNLYVTDNSCPGFSDLRAGRCNVVVRAD